MKRVRCSLIAITPPMRTVHLLLLFRAGTGETLHKKPRTWKEVFGEEADEAFAAYHIARYVNAVAEAGKKEYQLPLYANVWLREQKNFMRPGEAYPAAVPR